MHPTHSLIQRFESLVIDLLDLELEMMSNRQRLKSINKTNMVHIRAKFLMFGFQDLGLLLKRHLNVLNEELEEENLDCALHSFIWRALKKILRDISGMAIC